MNKHIKMIDNLNNAKSYKKYLLTCPEKTFERLYLDSLNKNIEDFAKYERARCIRHLSLYSILTLDHKKAKK